jgi:putative ABC transport system substrate-binding protein
MRRRDFITLLGGAAVAWPVAARAQQPAPQQVGFLGSDSPELFAERLRAWRQGLKETGYAEGQNVAIEYRWAEGRNDRLPELATDLVRRPLTAIVTSTTPSTLALKTATTTLPIIFFVAGDPVALGLVPSLNRPGGNLTGITTLTVEVGAKWLQLIYELIPTAKSFALLVNPTSSALAEVQSRDLKSAARTLGLDVQVLHAATDHDLNSAFSRLNELRVSGIVISSDSFFFTRCQQLAELAAHHKMPAIFGFREFTSAGGLMSYGGSVIDAHRLLGVYTGRVLKGERPADLPVQQATKVELIINLKTAKALGIDVPFPLLGRADEVIE